MQLLRLAACPRVPSSKRASSASRAAQAPKAWNVPSGRRFHVWAVPIDWETGLITLSRPESIDRASVPPTETRPSEAPASGASANEPAGPCHTGDLGVTLDGLHGMHPVGSSRFVNGGHEDLAEHNRDACRACHGRTGEGTVLSIAKATRTRLEDAPDGTVIRGSGLRHLPRKPAALSIERKARRR